MFRNKNVINGGWGRALRVRMLCLICCLGLTSCDGKGGGGAGGALLCSLLSAGVDQQSLTVGFGQGFLDAVKGSLGLLAEDEEVVNGAIKEAINNAFEAASISSAISLSSVESVPKSSGSDDDGVRFLKFDGSLAAGVNFVSTVLQNDSVQQALNESFGLTASSPFGFIEDSYQVFAAGNFHESTALTLQQQVKQWAYTQTDLDTAQTVAGSLENVKDQVVVAVIDTGVDLDHPALVNNLYRQNNEVVGYNFADDNANPDDDQGHGTHCAGIIAAEDVGDEGMTGVAQKLAPGKIKIMPVKVLGSDGSGSTAAINKGIRYAMAQGADVISMSLGGGVEFSDLQKSNGSESQIIRDAVNAGVIVVVAAGNEDCPLGGKCEQTSLLVLSKEIDEYTVLPCSYNGTICVGASDPDATLAPYSNYPSSQEAKGVDPNSTDSANKRISPDIIGPGSAIYSTFKDGEYRFLDGTSMATPYIAGLAALYKLKVPQSLETSSNAQTNFRNLLQAAEVELKEEDSATRSFVGQVDTAYFLKKLREFIDSTPAGQAPDLGEVDEPDSTGANIEAPNLLSLICGG
jgi:subtilisin family serine protease